MYDGISAADGSLVVTLENDIWVNSRANVNANVELAAVLPVGRAAAKGRSRAGEATGRGQGGWSSAPRRRGFATHRGHDEDDDWREEHRDELSRYDAVPAVVAIGYMGTQSEFSENPPPAGPLSEWDQRWTDIEPDQELTMDVEEAGWYRVGTQLESENGNHNFGWESVDFRLDAEDGGYEVDNPWKVSPRV